MNGTVYTFKLLPEMCWTVFVAALTYALTEFIGAGEIRDWRAFGLAVGVGSARAAAGALLAFLTRPKALAGEAG